MSKNSENEPFRFLVRKKANSPEWLCLLAKNVRGRFNFRFWNESHFIEHDIVLFQAIEIGTGTKLLSRICFLDQVNWASFQFNLEDTSGLKVLKVDSRESFYQNLDLAEFRFWDYERFLETFLVWQVTSDEGEVVGNTATIEEVAGLSRFGPYVGEPSISDQLQRLAEKHSSESLKFKPDPTRKRLSRAWWD